MGDAPRPADAERQQQQAIDHDPWSDDSCRLAVDRVLRRVADQAARIAHLVHHFIAGIDAGAAGDALVLQSVADIDAGRADLHADRAIDAVTQLLGFEQG